MASFTEENYLKSIYHLYKKQGGEVSTNQLAEYTLTKAASVSDMLKKLADKKLVDYQKYQGVKLSEKGEFLALQIIRKHRLWEVFLVEKLGFGWDEIHYIADQMEHIESEELTERLDAFLGKPKFDPHGDPIPDTHGKMPAFSYQKLAEITKKSTVTMVGVATTRPEFLQFLDKNKLKLGNLLSIEEINDFDKSMLIKMPKEVAFFISYEVAKNILVK